MNRHNGGTTADDGRPVADSRRMTGDHDRTGASDRAVVVGVDGSAPATAALDLAAAEAVAGELPLRIVHGHLLPSVVTARIASCNCRYRGRSGGSRMRLGQSWRAFAVGIAEWMPNGRTA